MNMKAILDQIEVGFELPSSSHIIDVHGMNKGESVDTENQKSNAIHFDEQFSKQQGFSAPVATGMTSTFYANQLLTDFFGEDWLRGGALATKYIVPMYFGETIVCRARVTGKEKEQAGCRLDMEIWAEKSDGQKNMIGSASVLVRNA
jgi:acyl dehydratase